MIIAIKAVALLILVLGAIVFFKPRIFKGMISFWKIGKRLYYLAAIRILFAAILLFGASECRQRGLVIGIGVIFLVSGLFIAVLGLERCRAMVSWMERWSDFFLRLLTIMPLALAALLFFAT